MHAFFITIKTTYKSNKGKEGGRDEGGGRDEVGRKGRFALAQFEGTAYHGGGVRAAEVRPLITLPTQAES